VASVKKVSDIVAEIAAASREQSSGIEQVNRAVMQMDELTQQNAALVEEATASSQAMADQARELNEMMARYRVSGEVGMSRASSQASRVAPVSPADMAPTVATAADGAPAVDRRSRNRPWAKRSAAAGLPAAAAPAAPAPRKQAAAAAAGGSDSDWQEF
jgi:methyl-accepting chemotaxis protein